MSIRRSARKQSFTVVDNAVFSSGLSYRAIGLLTFLLSKPDHWEVSVAHLVNASKESAAPSGRDAIYSTIRELESKGFITKAPKRNEAGKMDGMEYVVHDEPFTVEPHTDEPEAANPTQVNTEVKVNTEVSKKASSSSDDSGVIGGRSDRKKQQTKTQAKKPSKQQGFIDALINKGVDSEIAKEWSEVRKAKRATFTDGAINLIEREAGKAGISLPEAVQICALRGWQSLQADWVANMQKQHTGQNRQPEQPRKLQDFPMD